MLDQLVRETLSDEVTEECKPARIKREEETAVHFLEIPEGVFQGQGEPVQGPDI